MGSCCSEKMKGGQLLIVTMLGLLALSEGGHLFKKGLVAGAFKSLFKGEKKEQQHCEIKWEDVWKPHCTTTYETICKQEPQQECSTEWREECWTEHEEKCETEWVSECKTEYHKQCQTEWVEECWEEDEEICEWLQDCHEPQELGWPLWVTSPAVRSAASTFSTFICSVSICWARDSSGKLSARRPGRRLPQRSLPRSKLLRTLLIPLTTRNARTSRNAGGSLSRNARRLQLSLAGTSPVRAVLTSPTSGVGPSPRNSVRSTPRRNAGRPSTSPAGMNPGSTALRRRSRWPRNGASRTRRRRRVLLTRSRNCFKNVPYLCLHDNKINFSK